MEKIQAKVYEVKDPNTGVQLYITYEEIDGIDCTLVRIAGNCTRLPFPFRRKH